MSFTMCRSHMAAIAYVRQILRIKGTMYYPFTDKMPGFSHKNAIDQLIEQQYLVTRVDSRNLLDTRFKLLELSDKASKITTI